MQVSPDAGAHVNMTHITSLNSHYQSDVGWILDTGSTNHMSKKSNWLENCRLVDRSRVQLPIDVHVYVDTLGDCKFISYKILKNVLYLPNLLYNLISFSKMTS